MMIMMVEGRCVGAVTQLCYALLETSASGCALSHWYGSPLRPRPLIEFAIYVIDESGWNPL